MLTNTLFTFSNKLFLNKFIYFRKNRTYNTYN